MSKTSLFELTTELQALESLLIESESAELTPESSDAIEAWFAELIDQEGVKLDGYYYLIRKLDTEAASAAEEAERFRMKQQVRLNSVKRLKDRIKLHLETTGRKKIVTQSQHEFAVVYNGGVQRIEYDKQPSELPYSEFVRTEVTYKFDEKLIREAIASGDGPEWAKLVDRGTHLRVK